MGNAYKLIYRIFTCIDYVRALFSPLDNNLDIWVNEKRQNIYKHINS
jgi:hypothetical protein